MRRRLRRLRGRPVNYDPATLDLDHPPPGWLVDDRCQPLEPEPPGLPTDRGCWKIAKTLIAGYEFADPSIVRAFYEPGVPLLGREMVLELRALNVVHIHVGVRVVEVQDGVRTIDRRTVSVFGWAYRTLEGHVEQGQMEWMVFKWHDTGDVEFRVRAVSRPARIANPLIRIGFLALRKRERRLFLDSTERRMRELTALAVRAERPGDVIREASPRLTRRRPARDDPGHARLGRRTDRPE